MAPWPPPSHLASWTRGILNEHVRAVGRTWNPNRNLCPASMGGTTRSFSSQHPTGRSRHRRTLVTLDPSEMAPMHQQVYDFSGVHTPGLRTPRNTLLSPPYKTHLDVKLPYPSGAKGVFYYHLPPGSPPQAGELRFRKCDSVEQFDEGEDLQADVGEPWSFPLLNLVQSTARQSFLDEILLEQRLIDRELLTDLRRLAHGSRSGRGLGGFTRGGPVLHDIEQPFVTDVDLKNFSARLVTRQSVQVIQNLYLFWPMAGSNSPAPPPFRGRVRGRFELLERSEDKQNLTLQFRILEVLQPIEQRFKQALISEPHAGELLLRRKQPHLNFKPWSYTPKTGTRNHRALLEFLKCRKEDKAKFGV